MNTISYIGSMVSAIAGLFLTAIPILAEQQFSFWRSRSGIGDGEIEIAIASGQYSIKL